MDPITRLKKSLHNKRIYCVAGRGFPGYSGDGGPSHWACLNGPAGIGLDKDDHVYVADLLNHVIRKVDSVSKVIATVAGNGHKGFSGDGGPARAAALDSPEGVCVDRQGNIYIADSGNHRIRCVDAVTGVIRTVAGTGEAGFNGYDGDAVSLMLNHPSGVVVDSTGRVFCNDYGNDLIRCIAQDGHLTTYVGTGVSGYSGDGGDSRQACISDVYGMGLDSFDNLYFVDSLNFAIRKVDSRSRRVETVLGKGSPGELREFVSIDEAFLCGQPHAKGTIGSNVAHGVDVDARGNIYIAETGVHRLRMGDAESKLYFSVAGNGESGIPKEAAIALDSPMDIHGVRVDSKGRIYMVDFSHHVVSMVV